MNTAAMDTSLREAIEDSKRSTYTIPRRPGAPYTTAPEPGQVWVARTVDVAEKCKLALRYGRAATIGVDLVQRGVNEIIAAGALPQFMTARFASRAAPREALDALVSGLARGARASAVELADVALDELPGACGDGECDWSATIVGRAPREQLVDGTRVAAGDLLIGIASVGLHSSGLALAAHIAFERLGLAPGSEVAELGTTVERALFAPHKSYLGVACEPLKRGWVNAWVHVVEGGVIGSLERVLGGRFGVELDLSSWPELPLARWLRRGGELADETALRNFNQGLGMLAIVAPQHAAEFTHWLSLWNEPTWIVGRVTQHLTIEQHGAFD